MRRVASRTAKGFTLLEILTVIVIVGVIISVATVSVGVLGRDSEMRDQAERVWAVLTQAKEECELQGFDVGMRVGLQSYDFLRFDSQLQAWLPIQNDDLFAARELPEGLRFRLWIEGREVILSERPTEALDANEEEQGDSEHSTESDEDDEPPPQIMVLSSGDVNSFEMQLEREGADARWKVFSQPDGKIDAEQIDALL